MPINGDVQSESSLLNLSSGSSELRAEAREFLPREFLPQQKERQQTRSDGENGGESRRRGKPTGTVPKKSSSSSSVDGNSRRNWRNNQSINPRFPQQQRNGGSERYERGYEESSDNRTCFRDNQNYPSNQNNGRGSSRNDEYYSRNGNSTSSSSRYQQRDNRWDNRDSYDSYYQKEPNPRRSGAKETNVGQARKKPPQSGTRHKKEKPIEPSKLLQREQLIKDIESSCLECMICCDKIKDHQQIWSCSNCYHIQHLNCIKTWISNSKTDLGEWRCVACQFLRIELPRDYICFCGKEKYPAVNRNDLAHSCGNMCGRTDNCLHPCTLKCHPGPHAVCQSSVQRSCGCGKQTKTFLCSMKETFECEDACGKVLSCSVHQCQDPCHQGECKPCSELIEMKCYCEKESKNEICSMETALITKYSCNQECNKLLGCNNHRCALKCHPQNCENCALSPELVRNCPCGRTKVEEGQRKSCSDAIPLCKAICSKPLKCGPLSSPHVCSKTCHLGECPSCTKSTNVKCRCGRIEEKIDCKDLLNSDVRCKKKCTKFRTCGKHKCNQNCCIDLEHVCTQKCGRQLECKKHRCERSCHIGNCTQCPRASYEELRCECGSAVVYPPVPCGTRVPECRNKCKRTHSCTHPVSHLCHCDATCPPCVFLTTKFCYGKHEQRKTIPCNEDSFSCGMPCGKGLSCGRHSCIKKCHQGVCDKLSDVCKQPCMVKKECGHSCGVSCHEGACPIDKACREQIEVSCKCGNVKEMKTCDYVANENRKLQRAKMAMQMQDGDQVEFKDIFDTSKSTVKILECNYECATLERNRRLDIAFKVENPNLASYPKFTPTYTEFLRGFYKKEPAFTKMVHEKLTELVKLAKESKQKSRSHSFPVMNRDKRHVVHDLAAMFGVETQAYDAEPNRNVVATASRESVS